MKKTSNIPVTKETAQTPATPAPAGHWAGFGNLRDEMQRLLDAFEPRQWFDKWPGVQFDASVPRIPAIDLTENDTGYGITADLPGLKAEQIELKLANGSLTISGETSEEETKEEDTYHLRERRWGSFLRTIALPEDVDRDKIEAEFSKGVLTISMPKSAEALAAEKKIAVKAA